MLCCHLAIKLETLSIRQIIEARIATMAYIFDMFKWQEPSYGFMLTNLKVTQTIPNLVNCQRRFSPRP